MRNNEEIPVKAAATLATIGLTDRPAGSEPLVRAFVDSLRRRSIATRRAYGRSAVALVGYLRDRGFDLLDATPENLNDHLAWYAQTHANATVGVHRSGLIAFFEWLVALGFVEENIAERSHPPTTVSIPRPKDSLDELAILKLETARWSWSPLPARDRALVHLFLLAGLHVQEAASLIWDDVDFEARVLRIPVKGGRVRIVAFEGQLDTSLMLLRGDRERGHVFVNAREGDPLSERSMTRIVRHTGDAIGIENLTPRLLRLTFVQRQLADGKSRKGTAYRAGYTTENSLRRAVGALHAVIVDCMECDAKPNIGPLALRCRICLGTGTIVTAPGPYMAGLLPKVAASRLRSWSTEIRGLLPILRLDRRMSAMLDSVAFALLGIAQEISGDDELPVVRPMTEPAELPSIAVLTQRLRRVGIEARKLAHALGEAAWVDEPTRGALMQLGVNIVLLAWAIQADEPRIELWSVDMRRGS